MLQKKGNNMAVNNCKSDYSDNNQTNNKNKE